MYKANSDKHNNTDLHTYYNSDVSADEIETFFTIKKKKIDEIFKREVLITHHDGWI